jgi:hypothetical protein
MIAIPGTEDDLRQAIREDAAGAHVESTFVNDGVSTCGKYVFHLF